MLTRQHLQEYLQLPPSTDEIDGTVRGEPPGNREDGGWGWRVRREPTDSPIETQDQDKEDGWGWGGPPNGEFEPDFDRLPPTPYRVPPVSMV